MTCSIPHFVLPWLTRQNRLQHAPLMFVSHLKLACFRNPECSSLFVLSAVRKQTHILPPATHQYLLFDISKTTQLIPSFCTHHLPAPSLSPSPLLPVTCNDPPPISPNRNNFNHFLSSPKSVQQRAVLTRSSPAHTCFPRTSLRPPPSAAAATISSFTFRCHRRRLRRRDCAA
ncbi:hypothetical protein L596_011898 [Steinernema carpocapsae]|uniref:Uncharacterized protein n=1 Tax=Steinernema carpocapsae TaxID=34508 RepID=A0A4U5NVD6_STECR|nr:hypothetical protein L596_011898 [Steinernema carpocapsae]